jgi:hypothetical protein
MAVEEIFISMSFMEGRKSYYGLYLESKDQEKWNRDDSLDESKLKMKIRGCSWSTMNDILCKQLQQQLK